MKYLQKRSLQQTVLALVAIPLFIFSIQQLFKRTNNLNQFLVLLFFYFMLYTSLLLLYGASRRQKAYLRGIDGETDVIAELNKLEGLELINDINLPNLKGNIDHVAIHKGLIFCIETKNYSQFIKFQGNDAQLGSKKISNPVTQAKRNAEALSHFTKTNLEINVWVEPLVVLTGKQKVTQMSSSTTILSIDRLNEYLESIAQSKRAESLSKDEVQLITKMLHQRD